MKKYFEELLKVSDRGEFCNIICFRASRSVCTDCELATYIQVAAIHFIYSLDIFSNGQMFLFFIC